MRERPILFSGPMVRAILDGTKTQTRRVIHPQPSCARTAGDPHGWRWKYQPKKKGAPLVEWGTDTRAWGGLLAYAPWKAGDRLWVREAWAAHGAFARFGTGRVWYRADENPAHVGPWKPSIHMPRWASRITLEVTGVRVARLQHISEADAIAEGCHDSDGAPTQELSGTARGAYALLWDDLNADRGYGWDANPWVWVVEFRKVEVPANA